MYKRFIGFITLLFTVMSLTPLVQTLDIIDPIEEEGLYYRPDGMIYQYGGSEEDLFIPSKIRNTTIRRIKSLGGIYSDRIKSIRIPSSVERIDDWAFEWCTNLESIVVDEDNLFYSSKDGVLYNKDMTKLVHHPKGKDRSLYEIQDREKNNPSDWAITEIEEAKKYNLTTDKVLYNFQQNLTREEFCELSIKLYEELSGKKADLPTNNPFKDTENPEILKANALGIVQGRGEGIFAPDDLLTRQEVAVIFVRTIEAIDARLINTKIDNNKLNSYEDKNDIATWAYDELSMLVNLGIIHGISNTKIDPKGNATREQGVALVKRVYEEFK